jgi:hypothetical protein
MPRDARQLEGFYEAVDAELGALSVLAAFALAVAVKIVSFLPPSAAKAIVRINGQRCLLRVAGRNVLPRHQGEVRHGGGGRENS